MKEKITNFSKILLLSLLIFTNEKIHSNSKIKKIIYCPPNVEIKIFSEYNILCFNQKGKIYLTGAKNGVINWYKSTNNKSWELIQNQNDSVLIIGPLTTNTYYKAKVVFWYGYYYYAVYSNVIKITYKNVLPPELTFITDSVNCPGGNDGAINLIVTSGTQPYSYLWSNGATTEDINNLTAGKYSVTLIDNNQCREIGNTEIYEKNYIPLNPGNITGEISSTQCFNYNPSLMEINPTGGNGNYTYQWQYSFDKVNWQNITTANNRYYDSPALQQTTYFRVLVGLSGNQFCEILPKTSNNIIEFNILSDFKPGIITGENSSIHYISYDPGIMEINPIGATGSYQYQWQYSKDNINWYNIENTNSKTYDPGKITETTYFRVLIDPVGEPDCGEFTPSENTIKFTILQEFEPGDIQGEKSGTYYISYDPGIMSITSTGGSGNYIYQWQKSNDGIIWQNIQGANNSTYNPPEIYETTYFRVKVTPICDINCGDDKYSNIVVFTIIPEFNSGDINFSENNKVNNILKTTAFNGLENKNTLKSTSINNVLNSTTSGPTIIIRGTFCYLYSGDRLVITPSGCTGDYNFQWQKSRDNINWEDIEGATDSILILPPLTDTTYIRVMVTPDPICGPPQPSNNTILYYILPEFKPGNLTGDISATYCFNHTPYIIANPTGASGLYNYQWQKRTPSTPWQNIEGATNRILNNGNITETSIIRVLIDPIGTPDCGSWTPSYDSIVYNILPQFNAGNITGEISGTYCHNYNPGILTANPSGATGVYNYQWQISYDGTNWNNIQGATSKTYDPPALTQTTYYRVLVDPTGNPDCGNATPSNNIITFTILPQFNPGNITGESSGTYCYNYNPAALTANPSGASGTYNYQWQISYDGTNWNNIQGATSKTYDPPALTQTIYYRVLVDPAGNPDCGNATPSNNIITFTILPQFNPGNISGETSNSYYISYDPKEMTITPTGGSGVYIYQWQKSNDGLNWENIIGANNSSYNPSTIYQTTHFRVLVDPAGNPDCGMAQPSHNTIKITIYSEFIPGEITGETSGTYYMSYDPKEMTINPTGGSGNYNYQWQMSNDGINWVDIPGATGQTYNPPEIYETTYFRVEVTPICEGNCGSASYSNTIIFTILQEFDPGIIIVQNKLKSTNSGNSSGETLIIRGTFCYLYSGDRLVITPSGCTGDYDYQWQKSRDNINWEDIEGATDSILILPPLTDTTYIRVMVTPDPICGSPQPSKNKLLYYILPKFEPGYISGETSGTYCENYTPTTLQAEPYGGSGIYNYQWQYSYDGINWLNVSDATNKNYTPDPLKKTIYYRVLIDPAGNPDCGDWTPTDSILFTTLPAPKTTEITGKNEVSCYEQNVEYSVELTQGSKYIWEIPSNIIIASDTSGIEKHFIKLNFNETGGIIKVTEINTYGCHGDPKSLNITIANCNLKANFYADKTQACINDTITFINSTENNRSQTQYLWIFGEDALPSQATGYGPHRVVYNNPGQKSITLIAIDLKNDTIIKENYINIFGYPELTLIENSICGSGNVIFIANTTNAKYVDFSLDTTNILVKDNSYPFEFSTYLNEKDSIKIYARASNSGCTGKWMTSNYAYALEIPITSEILTEKKPYIDYENYFDIVCGNETKEYSITAKEGSNYTWILNDKQYNGEKISIKWDLPGGEYNLLVKEIAANGCEGTPVVRKILVTTPNDILPANVKLCKGDTFTFYPGSYSSYLWHDGSTDKNYKTTKQEKVWVKITDKYHCEYSDTSYVTLYNSPNFTLGKDLILCNEGPYRLEVTGFLNYEWSTGDISNYIIIYPGEKRIWLKVTDENGCSAVDTINILACNPEDLLIIPNVFTPNNDGVHDKWVIKNIELFPNTRIEIFDRWGRLVFRCDNGYHNNWDGNLNKRPLAEDTYYYIIDLKIPGYKTIKGTVTIIR